MLIKTSLAWLLLVFVLGSTAFAAKVKPDPTLVRFNYNDGQWLAPRDEFFLPPDLDLEAGQDKEGKLLAVLLDLNADGLAEYFLRTLCGNGGCEYPIFDGRTHVFLGKVFGSEVWLLRQQVHGFSVIQAFSRLSATAANIKRYEFNGSRYQEVSTLRIGEDDTQQLFRWLKFCVKRQGATKP